MTVHKCDICGEDAEPIKGETVVAFDATVHLVVKLTHKSRLSLDLCHQCLCDALRLAGNRLIFDSEKKTKQ